MRPQPEKGLLSKKSTMKLTIDYYYYYYCPLWMSCKTMPIAFFGYFNTGNYGENNKWTKRKTTTLTVWYLKNGFPPANNLKVENTQKIPMLLEDVVSLRIKILSEVFPNSFAFSLIEFSSIVVCCCGWLKLSVVVYCRRNLLFWYSFIVQFTEIVQNKTCINGMWQFHEVDIHCSYQGTKSCFKPSKRTFYHHSWLTKL